MSRMSCVAIILRAQPYGESDLIVDLYTQQRGRSRVIARGALRSKRRYMGVLEPGALVKVDYPLKPGLPTLGPCDVISSHRRLRQELSSLRQLYYILELILNVTPEDEPDEILFSSAVELLEALESAAGLPYELLYAWELRLLSHLGYQLHIGGCPYTQAAPDGLSYQAGGAISSRSGRPHWPVRTETLRVLYRLQRCQGPEVSELFGSISKSDDLELRSALIGMWSEITGRSFQSERVFRALDVQEPAPPNSSSARRALTPPVTHLSAPLLNTIFIIASVFSPMYLTACQGLEHLPSQATFEVQPSKLTPSRRPSQARQPEGVSEASESLPHLSSRPKGLPRDLGSLAQSLYTSSESVSIELKVQHQGTKSLKEAASIYCELIPSVMSAELITALTRAPLSVKRAQPKMWLEHEIPEELRPHFKDRSTLLSHLKQRARAHQARSDLFKPYLPIEGPETAWILYLSPRGSVQSLMLTQHTSWVYQHAWKIASCERGDGLSSLTYTPLDLQHRPTSPLKLVLVSAEVHTHPADE